MRRGLIAMFHVIDDEQWFEQTLQFLATNYQFVDLPFFEDTSAQSRSEKMPLHITFDDGDRSFYDKAFPLIQKYEAPTTLFVSPKIIEEENTYWFQEVGAFSPSAFKEFLANELNVAPLLLSPYHPILICKCFKISFILNTINKFKLQYGLSPLLNQNISTNELKEINASSMVTIGGHTMNHPILANESDEISSFEIKESVGSLSSLLNTEITRFACPNGTPHKDFGAREMTFKKEAGIRHAVSTEPRHLTKNENLLSLPRISLTHGSTRYLNLKLLAGKHWKWAERMRSKSEQEQRNNLSKLIKQKHLIA